MSSDSDSAAKGAVPADLTARLYMKPNDGLGSERVKNARNEEIEQEMKIWTGDDGR